MLIILKLIRQLVMYQQYHYNSDRIVQTCCLTITLATHSRKKQNYRCDRDYSEQTDRFTKSKQLTIDTSAPAVAPFHVIHDQFPTVSFFCSSSCTLPFTETITFSRFTHPDHLHEKFPDAPASH